MCTQPFNALVELPRKGWDTKSNVWYILILSDLPQVLQCVTRVTVGNQGLQQYKRHTDPRSSVIDK